MESGSEIPAEQHNQHRFEEPEEVIEKEEDVYKRQLEEYTNNIQESADEGTNDNQPLIEMLNSFLKGSNAPAKEEKKEDPAAAEAEKKDVYKRQVSGNRTSRGYPVFCRNQGGGSLYGHCTA